MYGKEKKGKGRTYPQSRDGLGGKRVNLLPESRKGTHAYSEGLKREGGEKGSSPKSVKSI